MKTLPKVSVIIPVYMVKKYIRECMDSVIGQTLRDIEIIAIDDGSMDNCGNILDEYASRDKRIHVIHQKNAGLSAARNTGLDVIKSQLVVFVDSDDSLHPEYCEKLYNAMTDGCADVAMCGVNVIYEDGFGFSKFDKRYFRIDPRRPLTQFPAVAWNKIYRTDFLREHGIRFPNGLRHEDEYFWNACLPWIRRANLVSDKLYNYRRRCDGIMGQIFAGRTGVRADSLGIAAALGQYYSAHGLMRGTWARHYWKFFDNMIRAASRNKRRAQCPNLMRKFIGLFLWSRTKRRHAVPSAAYIPKMFDENIILSVLKPLGKFSYFFNPGNMGDTLIAVSTYDFFRRHNIKYKKFNPRRPTDTIVYGGGAVWIDAYRSAWLPRLEYFKRAKRIVILPSSFNNCPELTQILDERFTIFCRERQSYDYLKSANTHAEIILANDMALYADFDSIFAVRPKLWHRVKYNMIHRRIWKKLDNITGNIARFMRRDAEAAGNIPTDLDLSNELNTMKNHSDEWNYFCAQELLLAVAQFDTIITNRLHVGIAAILTGRNVILRDNSYGKISNVYKHSLKQFKNARFVK